MIDCFSLQKGGAIFNTLNADLTVDGGTFGGGVDNVAGEIVSLLEDFYFCHASSLCTLQLTYCFSLQFGGGDGDDIFISSGTLTCPNSPTFSTSGGVCPGLIGAGCNAECDIV